MSDDDFFDLVGSECSKLRVCSRPIRYGRECRTILSEDATIQTSTKCGRCSRNYVICFCGEGAVMGPDNIMICYNTIAGCKRFEAPEE